MAGGARICLGQIGAAHGVRGEVRLWSFTADPEAIAAYGPLETEDGRVVQIKSLRAAKDHFVASLKGISDRAAAERLTNVKLYVARERLPEPSEPDEFYHADLIGLAVVDRDGAIRGTVVAVHNFGAGDLIEVKPTEGRITQLLPFDEATVPVVDLTAGRLIVEIPSPLAGLRRAEAATAAQAGEVGEAKPSRVRAVPDAKKALTRTDAGSRRHRSSLSRKGRG
jgi:16S rRNA processing protein RimM